AAALAAYYTSTQTDAAIAAAIAPYYTSAQTDAGQTWNGGPTFNLLRGSNVLRNLSVAGALTASFQNLDDTILIESDSYARSQTYTQAETGAAITAAIDALLSQLQNEAEVQALIAAALVLYWDQGEVSTYMAGELANYATSSSVTSAISSALSSYDELPGLFQALLDFYTGTEVDQQITNALGNVDLSNYYTQAETQSYVASKLPRTELDSQLTATFTQYWTSSRTQTEIDDAIAGAGFLAQTLADTRYSAPMEESFKSLVRTNVSAPSTAGSPRCRSSTADLTVNSLNGPQGEGALLASFAEGISFDRDVTVAVASTLNATTADITQLTVNSTATSAFSSNSSVTANLVVSNLRPKRRCAGGTADLVIEPNTGGNRVICFFRERPPD
ncbi:hypothetical protein AK812_SmicGene47166, partial [Symbiodinium microadriaticum]